MSEMIFQPINPLIHQMKLQSALRDRRIHINGIIDENLSFEVCYFLNRIRDLDKLNNTKEDITLVFNSYGGSVIHGNSIIGLINKLKNEGYRIIGLVEGFAYSMAFDILIFCTERIGYKYSQYMLHQTQLGRSYSDDLIEFERDIEFQKIQWELAVDYYVENTNIPREKIESMYNSRKNWYMLAPEALKLGVIHNII